jgi:hypothetical protein
VPVRCGDGNEDIVHHPCGVPLFAEKAGIDAGRKEENRGRTPVCRLLVLQVEVPRPDHGWVLLDGRRVAFHDLKVPAHLLKDDVADIGLILREPEKRLLGVALKRGGAVVHRAGSEIGAPVKGIAADIVHLRECKRTGEKKGGRREAQECEEELGSDRDPNPAALRLTLAHH